MKSNTLKGLIHLPEPMKKLLYDEQALYKILSDKDKLEKIKKSVEESKSTWNTSNIFHTTELIGCLTKAYYNRFPPEGYTDIQLQPSLNTMYYFFRGNIFDLIFSMAMPHSQIDFNFPVENDNGDDISIVGRVDWLDIENGKIVQVNDLKTTKSLYYVKKKGLKTEHYIQTMVYSYVFGAAKIRLYYLDMGELIVKEVNVRENDPDQENIIKELKNRARTLYKHVKEKTPITPPEIDYKDENKGWLCLPAYCPFGATCHPNMIKELESKDYDFPEGYKK